MFLTNAFETHESMIAKIKTSLNSPVGSRMNARRRPATFRVEALTASDELFRFRYFYLSSYLWVKGGEGEGFRKGC
jgi:hypothetical protein